MSAYLWKYYLEDDVDQFRQVLESATYNVRPGASSRSYASGQALNAAAAAFSIGSPGSLGTSPTLTAKARRDFGASSRGPLTLTRADINAKDANGLTILHHAASSVSESAFGFATALLDHPLTDLYSQDLENGWTALHRAFYFGNIAIARSIIDRDVQDALGHGSGGLVQHAGGLIKIKDKEGNGPLDLFTTTIKDRTLRPDTEVHGAAAGVEDDEVAYGDPGDDEERSARRKLQPVIDINGDELFTFGSNRNVTLGFGDEDDRQNPERILLRRPDHLLKRFYREHIDRRSLAWTDMGQSTDLSRSGMLQPMDVSELPTLIRSTPLVIQDVQMSKLHTAILTTDPESNLYMCGHGPGGRLGTGNETTQFQFRCIEGGALAGKKVIAVALGQNHSLALSDEGEIFTWGNNGFGQLGYSLPRTGLKDEDPIQTLPRQIYGPLKRELVVGIAASRIHSVAHTATALYTFGKNEGQLGIVDSDARSLEVQVTPRRVAASLFTTSIKSVAAIDRATICLLDNHEVWVFANYGYSKLSFPLDGFSNYFLKQSFLTTKYDNTPNRICKITAGGDTICALSSTGEVFTIAVSKRTEPGEDAKTSTTNPSKIRGALSQPYRIWSLKKGYMAARDVGVDQDGSIILTTEAGSVWRRVKRAKIKDATASNIGEYKAKDYKFLRVTGLTRVTAVRASAFGAYAAVRRDCDVTKTQVMVDEPSLWSDTLPLLPFHDWAAAQEDSDDENPLPAFWTSRRAPGMQLLMKKVLDSDNIEEDLSYAIRGAVDDDDSTYDMMIGSTVSEVRIPVHQFMFSSRSRVLRQEVLGLGFSDVQEELFSITKDESGRLVLLLHGVDILTAINLALYVYTDNIVDVWHYARQQPENAFRYRQVRTELMKIAQRLELRNLEAPVRQMVRPKRTMTSDMEVAIQDPSFFDDGDVIIQLSDGEHRVHSALMVQRCPFFEGLFKGRAGGRWLAGRRADASEAINVDMKHIDKAIFELVLRHIYADTGEELFDEFVSDDMGDFLALNDYLDHIMDVMSVANELMLDRLSQICQSVIGRYVNVRNVCQLLNAVSPCSVTEFRDAALEYICLSLEAVLQNGLLDELDEDLIFELDQVVRENQLACLPFARSGRTEALLLEKYPDLAERIDRSRRAKLDAIMLQNKYADGDSRMSTSLMAASFDESSRSPMLNKARRRSTKDKGVHSSPMLAPALKGKNSTADLMFDMDDEDGLDDATAAGSDDGQHGGEVLPAGLTSPSSPWQGSKSASRDIPDVPEASLDNFSPPASGLAVASPSSASAKPSIPRTPGKPWGTAPLQGTKLDMRDIMAQDSPSKPSNLSLAISAQAKAKPEERPSGSFSTAKLSQKERKKLQQSQQNLTSQLTADIKDTKPASPWQVQSSGPKIALKDVLATPSPPTTIASPQNSTPSTRPNLTMRQTIANNGAASKAKPTTATTTPQLSRASTTQLPPTPPTDPTTTTPSRQKPTPSKQTPNSTSTSSRGFAIPPSSSTQTTPQIQSIRHIPSPSAAETAAALQLSMADILEQQQMEKDVIRDAVAKRSLEEIQQEQAFQEWWDKESRRVREEEEEAVRAVQNGGARKEGRGGGGARGKGKGGRGGARGGGEGRKKGDGKKGESSREGGGKGDAPPTGHALPTGPAPTSSPAGPAKGERKNSHSHGGNASGRGGGGGSRGGARRGPGRQHENAASPAGRT
ncbi:hypothetical protein K490DRAFT_61722 [Saccharata proteae CBS 121410]|uniref:BTB domain-containing protein n=1 Tax=Saccharata proteae CBS 121410 TaxID=1314787 RepID=A0A9P4I5Q0_9PEZI|nr:hypothetical protein K490DRAFT_61722 [Saccharata proteae CBS 121410]